ncbi:hypothetical protein [uncultured Moraxella sp.]|uniref:hypothetical protein n=1 Tax=uncultured Moraxella sp. TaxID=263769 RepID=UPI0025FE68E5|nr:hypothetical protein [uncultured Moraxella sp.]
MNKVRLSKVATVTALSAVIALPSVSQANFLDKLNKGLGKVTQVLGTVGTATSGTAKTVNSSPFADATDDQIQKIVDASLIRTGVAHIDKTLDEAKENIGEMMLMASCSKADNLNFGRIQAADAYTIFTNGVLSKVNHHPKDRCMTAQSMGGFKKPANNQIEFNVVYYSEISGEGTTCEVIMRDDYGTGNWLVKKHWCRN